MPRKKTHQEFLNELQEKNPTIIVLGQYVNSSTKIKVQCSECQYIWETTSQTLLSGHGCPQKNRHKNYKHPLRKTHEEFIDELAKVNPTIEVLGLYSNAITPIEVRCINCGNTWSSKPCNLLYGHSCRICSHKQGGEKLRLSNADFLKKLGDISPSINPLEQYSISSKKIKCYCTICGHIWSATPNNLLHGYGCPACKRESQTSFPEQALFFYIKKTFPDAINGYREMFNNTELDIFIPSIRIGIEYDGKYWHNSALDKEKQKYCRCKELGIFLIRIRESIIDDIHEICDKNYLCDYGKGDVNNLEKCILQILHFLSPNHYIEVDINKDNIAIQEQYILKKKENSLEARYPNIAKDWNYSRNGNILPSMVMPNSQKLFWWKCSVCGFEWQAKVAQRIKLSHSCPKCAGYYKTTEEFLTELAKINNRIELLEPYKKATEKILCKCLICGNEWYITPIKLLGGRSCPKCAIEKSKLSEEQFLSRLSKKRPDVLLLSQYNGGNKEIKCKCKICGYEWTTTASRLFAAKGCLNCSGHIKKTNSQFIAELEKSNPYVIPLDEYTGSNTKIRCQCKRCGNEWMIKPSLLLRGHSCRKCANNNLKKTTISFTKEVESLNPSITVVGDYTTAIEPINLKCKNCGLEWSATPANFKKNPTCPNCRKLKPHGNMKSTETFKRELYSINPNINVIEDYKGVHKPIRVQCNICKAEFLKAPHELLLGRGCKCQTTRKRS